MHELNYLDTLLLEYLILSHAISFLTVPGKVQIFKVPARKKQGIIWLLIDDWAKFEVSQTLPNLHNVYGLKIKVRYSHFLLNSSFISQWEKTDF